MAVLLLLGCYAVRSNTQRHINPNFVLHCENSVRGKKGKRVSWVAFACFLDLGFLFLVLVLPGLRWIPVPYLPWSGRCSGSHLRGACVPEKRG